MLDQSLNKSHRYLTRNSNNNVLKAIKDETI